MPIANLNAVSDTIVVTQEELVARASSMVPDAISDTVANFMSSPTYDQIINSLTGGSSEKIVPVTSVIVAKIDAEIDLKQIDEVIFAHQPEHMGSATMGVQILLAIFKNHGIKIPVSEVECIGLGAFNNENIMIVTTQEFTKNAKAKAPNAQHLSVDSLITTPEYDKMVARLNQ